MKKAAGRQAGKQASREAGRPAGRRKPMPACRGKKERMRVKVGY